MKSLEGIVHDAFAKASERADSAANKLSSGLTNSLEELGKMIGETETRSNSASENMKKAIQEAVEEAVSRFSDATEEIRRAAGDIRKELDNTRSEIKRGIFDLPDETRESTAAMRKAVADQIKALKDLSNIVEQSAGVFEHSGPGARTAQAAAPVQSSAPQLAAVAQQPASAPAPTAAPVVSKMATPETVATVVEEPPVQQPKSAIDLRGGLGIMNSGNRAKSSDVSDTARKPLSEGWVRDLLRGASREENLVAEQQRSTTQPQSKSKSRNPRQVVESLNSLSVDIARAIDHDTSVELWRRYQNGERDIFTRRLYTLKGQKTFEEIKRKYDQEPEFRNAVDHYIADFEKLLADVSANDRDKTVTQSYLTSDTGKVYTMLAHASGRLK